MYIMDGDLVIDSLRRMTHPKAFLVASIITIGSYVVTAATPALAISDRRIEDARFACLAFMKGEKDEAREKDVKRAQVARFWLISFLTGKFEADEVLEFTEQTEHAESDIVARVKEFCANRDDVSIHAAAVYAGQSPTPLPGAMDIGIDPRLYSCAAYSAARDGRGEEKNQAKAAEFWAFAFVQGNISVRYHPRVVVSVSDKRKIVRALKQSCARNPNRNLLDQTAEIAYRVRPEWDQGEWD